MHAIEALTAPTVVFTGVLGAAALLLFYILSLFRKQAPKNVSSEDKKKPSKVIEKPKKKLRAKWSRLDKQAFSHAWLYSSLKGHTGEVMDMDYSPNGKYLASCGNEDPDPGGELSTSSSESNKDSGQSVEASPRVTKGLSRRQRKNRRREDSSPPAVTKKLMATQLQQYLKINISDSDIANALHIYLLKYWEMENYGYPVTSDLHNGLVTIYKKPYPSRDNRIKFDVNAREFVPKSSYNDNDSGRGSSSDISDGTEEESNSDQESTSSLDSECGYVNNFGTEHTCVRCGNLFLIKDKKYVKEERCQYHWGKQVLDTSGLVYTCCNRKVNSKGCTTGRVHVWNGIVSGLNGPYEGYVRTRSRKNPPIDGNYGVYALDCEMCYTVEGLELTKVTVVGTDGRLVYDSYVKPENEIVDYNTRFSGITPKDLTKKSTKTLKEVQNDLMGFINANTILIGHGLENDLRALKMVHYYVVDTAHTFAHHRGYKRSLKTVTAQVLKRDIQCGSGGHIPYEDAAACMELMLWRVRKECKGFVSTAQKH